MGWILAIKVSKEKMRLCRAGAGSAKKHVAAHPVELRRDECMFTRSLWWTSSTEQSLGMQQASIPSTVHSDSQGAVVWPFTQTLHSKTQRT
jgi:hypothetical protein